MAWVRTAPPRHTGVLRAMLLLAAVWTYCFRLGAPALLDDPNDGQYAEVAREMFESGEWISPQLDGVLFLNKPPLLYWLIAGAFHLLGVSELAARLPNALAAMLLVVFTWQLGRLLWDERVGLMAAAVLLATSGIMLEARQVRPDLWLTTGIVGTLLAATRILDRPGDRVAALLFPISLAVAVLAKGMIGLLLPAAALAVASLASGKRSGLRALAKPGLGLVFLFLVAPWHLLTGLRHSGFAWDYIVNQHFLFFLDLKLPRDSEGIALWQFWAAFCLRLLPWTLFLPLALRQCWLPGQDVRERWNEGLLLGWLGAVLGFFSLAVSRLEHYTIPALPACALLLARLFQSRQSRGVLAAHALPLALAGLAAPLVLPSIIRAQDWLSEANDLPGLGRVAGGLFATGACGMLLLAAKPRLFPLPMIAAMCAAVPILQSGLSAIAPLNSSQPLAALVDSLADEGDLLVYEAPMEYQQVAGLVYYTRRKWWLLRPEGFVAPPYLAPHENDLFLPPEEFVRRWQGGRVFFVSNPLEDRATLKGIVPEPFWVIARHGNRWLASNERPRADERRSGVGTGSGDGA
jgi:4-amino-4-deoxy-L-arabinose transferase-like glycosyltransferase